MPSSRNCASSRVSGALARENEILDSPAFEMGTVGMAAVGIVIVVAMIVAASVMVMRSVLMGLKVEPRAGIRLRVGRVETRKMTGAWRSPPATNRPRRCPLTG